MTTITIDRALLEQALEALDNIPHPPWRDKELADAIRAELAKPVERVEPITLDQFRAIAHDWRGANSQSVQCAGAIRKGE